jgi:leader peptidase (prepilin peptidase)/N-methyltransferase
MIDEFRPHIVVALGLFGAMIGSFLNVVIGRLPAGQSVIHPGSRCPSCKTPIRWFDNIPVVSYLVLRARCRACSAPISIRYPIVELTTAVAFALQAVVFFDRPVLLASRLVFTAMLIVLFGTDLDTQRLPNVLTLPGIALGLGWSLLGPPGPVDSLIGAAMGAGILLAIRWRQVWVVLFLSSLAGAVIGIALSGFRGRSMQSRLPFGTFLAIAAFVASVWGDDLITWYAGLYS